MRYLSLLLLPSLIFPVQAQFTYDDAVFDAVVQSEQHIPLATLKNGGPPTRGFDMKYLRCAWELDPAVHAITGSVTSWFTATADIDVLTFDLTESLIVDDIQMHGTSVTFDHTAEDLLQITLPSTLFAGETDSVTVTYHGIPPNTGFGSFITDTHNGIPVLWTLSEPYGAKDWWPCKQDLNDKIDSLDVLVTTPSAYRAAGNGLLVSEEVNGPNTTWHWRHRYPIDQYLIATAVTNYAVDIQYAVLDGDSVPMITYAYPEDLASAQVNAGETIDQMVLFSQLFGKYPFANEKYGHAQFGWGGGMEHQTMTFLGAFQYDLSAHELAHQWFGDKVTCGSWQDIWLNEGFATYLTGLCYEYLEPYYWQSWKQSKIDNITSASWGSVFCTDTMDQGRLFDGRLSYNKGAMVIHMLRWITGDSAFYHGLQAYLDDPDLAYGTAITDDLQAHLEATSGMDLDGFFADWYIGEGYPTYTATWTQDQGGQMDVTLDQTTSHPSVDFFELPVPIKFSGQGMDSIVVLANTQNSQHFNFQLPFTVEDVEFDPDLWLVSANDVVARVNEIGNDETGPVLYPNPTATKLNWRLRDPVSDNATIQVVDACGRVVLQRPASAGSITISSLPQGSYVFVLMDRDRTSRAPFVKY